MYPGGDEAKSMLAFHGTKSANIPNIVKTNKDTLVPVFIFIFSVFPQASDMQVECFRENPSTVEVRYASLRPGYDSHRVMADTQGRGI